ncbi:hypothetical protein PN584_15010 [Parabacteroides merdae]|nr:hypothetical protein [Parabacteroides merdae]MDB8914553.1 hypothetical protein [Parabacteroides merdae]
MDFDSFSPKGGTAFLEQAMQIVYRNYLFALHRQ